MQIGDTVRFVPAALRYSAKKNETRAGPVPGRVVWIHPELRFVVVERRTEYYTYRETVRLTRAEKRTLNENNEIYRNHEPERWGRENGHGSQFGRRAASGR